MRGIASGRSTVARGREDAITPQTRFSTAPLIAKQLAYRRTASY